MGAARRSGVGFVSYAAGCAVGAVIIVSSVGVLYPVAVVLRWLERLGGGPPPRIAAL